MPANQDGCRHFGGPALHLLPPAVQSSTPSSSGKVDPHALLHPLLDQSGYGSRPWTARNCSRRLLVTNVIAPD